jgi:asparagine synthase (glutamine-hydrolysing)
MLEGVDRVVDLVGLRSSGLSGATDASLAQAIRTGDVSALAATDGHFAGIGRDDKTVRLARTIGLPLRYFVAKMYHGPLLVVADRIDRIFEWCEEQRIAWQFDPAYTRMVPAHYLVEVDQVGCPDPAPRYRRFFDPAIGGASADLEAAGIAYVGAAYDALRTWLAAVPDGQAIAVAFSGGVDSTAVLLLARKALADLGRRPDLVRAFSLDCGGGLDAAQAARTVRDLGLTSCWEAIGVAPDRLDLEEAIGAIEDYHPLDVECAAASLALLRGIRERHPSLSYLLDGDGGDENLKSYPLEDSDLTLSSVLRNPLLYQEGWGVENLKHSVTYSGGLSRGYVRTCAPAALCGFAAFSPFTVRSAIAAALAIPFEDVLAGHAERLATLKQEVVRAGVLAVTGIEMPVNPKRRFQDGARALPARRVAKAWCRQRFDDRWKARLREAEDLDRRSGNEMVLA